MKLWIAIVLGVLPLLFVACTQPICGDAKCDTTKETPLNCRADCGECAKASDCGSNGWTGVAWCEVHNGINVVMKEYITNSCQDSGTQNAKCKNITAARQIDSCTGACSNGACISTPICVNTCSDSDGGENYYERGTVSGTSNGSINCSSYSVSDFCGTIYLHEMHCNGVGAYDTQYRCPYGCENGACRNETNETNETCLLNLDIKDLQGLKIKSKTCNSTQCNTSVNLTAYYIYSITGMADGNCNVNSLSVLGPLPSGAIIGQKTCNTKYCEYNISVSVNGTYLVKVWV